MICTADTVTQIYTQCNQQRVITPRNKETVMSKNSYIYICLCCVETGSYEDLEPAERYCFQCTQEIESEHVLLVCPTDDDSKCYLNKEVSLRFPEFYCVQMNKRYHSFQAIL